MKNLVKINWIFLVMMVGSASSLAQFPNRLYKNALRTTKYSNIEGIHARAMLVDSNQLIIGTNEGLIFSFDQNLDSIVQWESTSFREIRDLAIVDNYIVAMASGDTSALIFYDRSNQKIAQTIPFYGVFLDGMDELDNTLFIMGDPVDGKFSLYTYTSTEGLRTMTNRPNSKENEAAFAASGSTVHITENGDKVFVSGGGANRVFIQRKGDTIWQIFNLPIGNEPTTGIYSLFIDGEFWYAAGGDYLQPLGEQNTGFYSNDVGQTWKKMPKGPKGYRSCITQHKGQFYVCGTSGIDLSKNGKRWKQVSSNRAFAMISFGELVIFSGENGKLYSTIKLY